MGYVIPILILVAFSALFSSTETAFACVNKIRLKHMADSGDKRAEKALDIANRYLRAKAMGGSVTIPGEGNAEAHSSGSLSAMIGCNCLVELPAGSGPVTPGEEVEVLSFVQ